MFLLVDEGFLFRILTSNLDVTGYLGSWPRKCLSGKELFSVEGSSLRDVLEETSVAALLVVACVENSTQMRLLDEYLT